MYKHDNQCRKKNIRLNHILGPKIHTSFIPIYKTHSHQYIQNGHYAKQRLYFIAYIEVYQK